VAEALITVVSLGSTLEAEVEIDAADIGHVAKGDAVRVKLQAFPFQRHGLLEGTLRTLSEYALRSRQAGAGGPGAPKMFYRARVALDSTGLRNVPKAHRLLPGMQVNAEICVGDRRIISYFLHPLIACSMKACESRLDTAAGP
jgi:hemolysin D